MSDWNSEVPDQSVCMHSLVKAVIYASDVQTLRSKTKYPDKTVHSKPLLYAGLWNYQILFLVRGQVNGQNPLVQPRFTYLKIDIFLTVFTICIRTDRPEQTV